MRGRAFAEIDERRAAVGEADEHESPAADIACGGMRHSEREGNSNCGIDGVTAGFENGFPGVRRVGFAHVTTMAWRA